MPFFPIAEPKKKIMQELRFSPKEISSSKKSEMMEWHFHGKDREKIFIMTPLAISIEYKKYKVYDDLKEEFLKAIELIFNTYNDIQIKRLGLRYINNISLNEDKPLVWDDYLNKHMLCTFKLSQKADHISRCLINDWSYLLLYENEAMYSPAESFPEFVCNVQVFS